MNSRKPKWTEEQLALILAQNRPPLEINMIKSKDGRMQLDLREAINKRLAIGWKLVSRSPLTLRLGHITQEPRVIGSMVAFVEAPKCPN